MELFLLRHGIPVDPMRWKESELTRPLTPLGREQVGAVIETLSDPPRLAVDQIWTSPLARCEETARIAAAILKAPFQIVPALAIGANLLLSLPHNQGAPSTWPARLMCVGHQPDLGDLVGSLTGDAGGGYGFGRCGIARLTGEFTSGGMKLHWLLTAEEALLL